MMDFMDYVEEDSLLYYIRSHLNEYGELPADFSLDYHVNGARKLESETEGDFDYFLPDGLIDGNIFLEMDYSDEIPEPLCRSLMLASEENYVEAAEAAADYLSGSEPRRMIQYVNGLYSWVESGEADLKGQCIYNLAYNILRQDNEIEMVKFALFIMTFLDASARPEAVDMINLFSRSDEFTLFCTWAMKEWPNRNERTFDMLRHVKGWGRITGLSSLSPETEEIRRWLVTDGWKTSLSREDAVLTVVHAIDVEEFLGGKNPADSYIFKNITAMLKVLLHSEEGDDYCGMDQMENPWPLCTAWLSECSRQFRNLEIYETAAKITRYAYRRAGEKEALELKKKGTDFLFTAECRDTLKAALKEGKGQKLAEFLGLI